MLIGITKRVTPKEHQQVCDLLHVLRVEVLPKSEGLSSMDVRVQELLKDVAPSVGAGSGVISGDGCRIF